MSQVSGLNASSRSSLHGHTPSSSQYHVHKGDTLSGIAARHGVSLGALERANPGIAGQRFIFPGDKLVIPSGSQASAQNTASHTINRGETLSSIAAKHGTTVQAIADANPGTIKNVNHIYPGDTIVIPEGGRVERASGAQTSKASGASAPVSHAPVSANKSVSSAATSATAIGQINLREFFDPSKGSQSPAAIIIGNAEGNRTPSGGERAGYKGHIDPGNGKGNRGSFSYQHGTRDMTPQQADKAQLAKLSKLIPVYEAAAKKAGLDPNNATLATAYFDLFNQSESAAGRFLGQIGDLKATGITNQSVTELRFHSFVDKNTGQRFTWTDGKGKAHTAGGGFAKIAKDNLNRTASEAEVQKVIYRDQARRQNAMADAMKVQNVGELVSSKPTADWPSAPQLKTKEPRVSSRSAEQPLFTYNRGIDLPPMVIAQANSLYNSVKTATGFSIHITSGRRLADRQAAAMYDNYATDLRPPSYKNKTAEAQIRTAYDLGRRNGWPKSQTVRAMTNVIQQQINNGVLISKHMSSKGLDISTPPASVLTSIRNDPNVQSARAENDHIHIQFK